MKKLLIAWFVLLLLCSNAQAANIPYRTYAMGEDGTLVETQTAYEPVRVITRFGGEKLKTPQDIFWAANGHLYIADTGNKRILEVTASGDLIKEYGSKKTLKEPTGIFVDDELNIYVADKGNRKVIVFNPDGDVIKTYGRPDHPMYGEKATFTPVKLVLDSRGNMYILSQGNTNGVIQLSTASDGEFIGYFGANTSAVSFATKLKKLIYSDDQLNNINVIPVSLNNIAIDTDGMIYTVSAKEGTEFMRRLNVAGSNTIKPDWFTSSTKAVAVHSPSGSIYTANINGEFMEFNSEGSLLFKFNAYDSGDQRTGTFRSVTGMAVDNDYTLYVVDEIQASLTVFKPTGFADSVHQAFEYFQAGQYAQSKEPWQQVLQMNSLFTYANTGMGDVLYRENKYEEAMEYFYNGGNREGYSEAFWEVRADWLHRNLFYFIIAVAVLYLLIKVLGKVNQKHHFLAPVTGIIKKAGRIEILYQLKYSLYLMRNPFDACYGIKREGKASYRSAWIVLVIFFAAFVANKYLTGFLFSMRSEGVYELPLDAALVFGIFLLVVISLYLVCSIKDGEAHLRDIFIGCAYSLIPVIILFLIRLVLTNVLTYNEQFFITLASFVCYGFAVLLLVLSVMFLNDYSLKKTIGIIILSLFTALIITALLFVIYTLSVQLVNFISSIYGEVVYRFVR
ncbi:MAG: hypothetical protein IJD39_03910 [Clostridia bacterium]|nr:hypothetical protein [Clostridia bacterium]